MSNENKLDQLRADLEVLQRWQNKHGINADDAIWSIQKEIGYQVLKSEVADPWHLAKFILRRWKDATMLVDGDRAVLNYVEHLISENDRLSMQVWQLGEQVKAMPLMHAALQEIVRFATKSDEGLMEVHSEAIVVARAALQAAKGCNDETSV